MINTLQGKSFHHFTPSDVELATDMVVDETRRDSKSRRITPFATTRDLMGGPPPPRWRPVARWRWFRRLHRRVEREIENQVAFAKSITRTVSL